MAETRFPSGEAYDKAHHVRVSLDKWLKEIGNPDLAVVKLDGDVVRLLVGGVVLWDSSQDSFTHLELGFCRIRYEEATRPQ
jgi:hypothetical protein